jgi:hypothetical protein
MFPLRSGGRAGQARLTFLSCTCTKAGAGAHAHHFIESELLRTLEPGSGVRVEIDDAVGALRVERVP